MKKASLLISILILLLFLSGCWDYKEINDVSLTRAITIDWEEETKEYIVCIQLINLKGMGKGVELNPQIIEGRGKTIVDALKNIIAITAKSSYWGHLTMIIIGQDIANKGLDDLLDWIARSPEVQLTINILLSTEKTAKEILTRGNQIKMVVMTEYGMIKAFRYISKMPNITANKVINHVQRKDLYAVIPTIKIVEMDGESFTEIAGSAYFKNGKLAGVLSSIDTMKFIFIINEIEGGILTIPTGERNSYVTLDIFRSSTKTKIDFPEDDIQITVNIKPIVNISEIDGFEDYTNKKGRKVLKEMADSYLEKEIEGFIEEVQKSPGIDIFNFGNKIKKTHPRVWKKINKDWEEIFKELKVVVNSDIKIKSSRHISKPIGVDTE
ncbi:Ger(x)C family spore germination protein [Tissierella creatinini]|nr:Ger(x)C family spore germination protein [Tissierella creatinini]TJX63119.1 Ger(x)C family spore germination protein [Soehngenia saccharolytica]